MQQHVGSEWMNEWMHEWMMGLKGLSADEATLGSKGLRESGNQGIRE